MDNIEKIEDEKFQKVPKDKKQRKRDFLQHQETITEIILNHVKETKKIPGYKIIKEESGLSEKTIHKHIKQINLQNISPKFKMYIEPILQGLTEAAMEGKSREVKLWMQLVENYKENNVIEVIDKKKALKELESIFE